MPWEKFRGASNRLLCRVAGSALAMSPSAELGVEAGYQRFGSDPQFDIIGIGLSGGPGFEGRGLGRVQWAILARIHGAFGGMNVESASVFVRSYAGLTLVLGKDGKLRRETALRVMHQHTSEGRCFRSREERSRCGYQGFGSERLLQEAAVEAGRWGRFG